LTESRIKKEVRKMLGPDPEDDDVDGIGDDGMDGWGSTDSDDGPND
jgi:hypothetical protein